MTQRPTPPLVKPGFWRRNDGTKEHGGVRIWCGQRHIYVEPHNIRSLADQLHDYMDEKENLER